MKNKILKNRTKIKRLNTVIEFSLNTIKLAQVSLKDKRVITHLACRNNIKDSESDFINALEKIIKTNHLKIDNLIVSLDRSLVSMHCIKLPSVNEEEIKQMVQWQAAKLLPYKIDDIVVSHQTITSSDDGFSYILLIIVPKNIVKRFIDICDALKLIPQSVTISSEGLLSWYRERQPQTPTGEATALIDIDRDRFELAVLYQDKFIFSRSLTLLIDNDMQLKKKIIEETKLSLESYKKQDISQPLKKIVLTGDKAQISEFASLFSDGFNLTPNVINHLENIELEKGIVHSDIESNVSFASICGHALNQRPPKINLLPQDVKDRALYLEKKNQLFKTAYLAISAILVCFILLGFSFYTKKKNIANLNSQLDKINPTAKQIQDIKNKMAIINTQLDNENSCIEVLREIHKITPEKISLTTFIFEENKGVTLKGLAPAMSLVFNFVPILNKSVFFKDVQVRFATQRKTQVGELTDFEIICPLRNKREER